MIACLVLDTAAGGYINGLAGTGTALFALGFYLLVLPPVTAVAIVALMSVLAGLQGLWVVRAEITANPLRVLRFILPGLAGVPLGITLLRSHADASDTQREPQEGSAAREGGTQQPDGLAPVVRQFHDDSTSMIGSPCHVVH